MNEVDKKQSPVEALRRGLLLIDQLSSHPEGMMLSELSMRLELQRTTVHNLLKTLVYAGYAENDGNGRYRLGWHLHELCRISRTRETPTLTNLMGALTAELGESLILAYLVDGQRRVLYHTDCNQAIQVSASYMEQNATSIWNLETGIILAAFASEEELSRLIQVNGTSCKMVAEGITGGTLADELSAVRERRYVSLSHTGIYAAAVPVMGDDGKLIAALGINQPLFRHNAKDEKGLIEKLHDGARRIAAVMDMQ